MKKKVRKAKRNAKKPTQREIKKICEMCGCHSGKKWEECCGRCKIPC
jgi:hypothetical protein